jgi:hypothetical protein
MKKLKRLRSVNRRGRQLHLHNPGGEERSDTPQKMHDDTAPAAGRKRL